MFYLDLISNKAGLIVIQSDILHIGDVVDVIAMKSIHIIFKRAQEKL